MPFTQLRHVRDWFLLYPQFLSMSDSQTSPPSSSSTPLPTSPPNPPPSSSLYSLFQQHVATAPKALPAPSSIPADLRPHILYLPTTPPTYFLNPSSLPPNPPSPHLLPALRYILAHSLDPASAPALISAPTTFPPQSPSSPPPHPFSSPPSPLPSVPFSSTISASILNSFISENSSPAVPPTVPTTPSPTPSEPVDPIVWAARESAAASLVLRDLRVGMNKWRKGSTKSPSDGSALWTLVGRGAVKMAPEKAAEMARAKIAAAKAAEVMRGEHNEQIVKRREWGERDHMQLLEGGQGGVRAEGWGFPREVQIGKLRGDRKRGKRVAFVEGTKKA